MQMQFKFYSQGTMGHVSKHQWDDIPKIQWETIPSHS